MIINQILQQEIKNSELWLSREKDESTYKRDLKKRIELINWVETKGVNHKQTSHNNGNSCNSKDRCLYSLANIAMSNTKILQQVYQSEP